MANKIIQLTSPPKPIYPPLTPYRQDPNLGEDKGGLLGPKKDNTLLDKAHPNFWVQAAEDSQFCQALRYQNRSN